MEDLIQELLENKQSLSQRSKLLLLINFKSTGVEAVIGATFCHQGSMVASFDDTSVVHHHDHIELTIVDRRWAMTRTRP